MDLKTGLVRFTNPAKNKAINPERPTCTETVAHLDDTNLFRRACAFGGAAAFATSGVACAAGGAACAAGAAACAAGAAACAAGAAACAAGAAACAAGAAACAWFGRAKLFKNPREKVKSTPGSKQMAVGYKKLNTFW